MRSSISHHASSESGWTLALLWAGLTAGPLAWAAQLEVNYILSYVACETRTTWMLHLSTAIALVVVGFGALAARRAWPAASADTQAAGDTALTRTRAMALSGLVLCAWFALVILATDVPALVLRPCTL
jgi:hypothetical protein